MINIDNKIANKKKLCGLSLVYNIHEEHRNIAKKK